VNGNSVGTVSTEEQFASKGTNSCNTTISTSETCSPDSDGVLKDAITVGCNSVGGSCGVTFTKQQWLYCPASGTPVVFATPGDLVIHNNSVTVGGYASFPAGTAGRKSLKKVRCEIGTETVTALPLMNLDARHGCA
jgi:hypothetical protein